MKDDRCTGTMDVIDGHLLHLSEGYDVAIYTRNDVCWVAEFHDDRAALFDATIWLRFYSGRLRFSHAQRAAALDSASALTPEVLAQIDRLHHRADDAAARTSLPAAVANAVRRWFGLTATRGSPASRRAQDVG
jgi:hypothetical protein